MFYDNISFHVGTDKGSEEVEVEVNKLGIDED